jgi:hypothetical protein
MADTTSTTITTLLPSLVGPAVEAFEQESNLRDLVTVYRMDNGTLTVPTLGTFTPVAVSEGDLPGPGEAYTPGSATLTSAKYRVTTTLTDQAVNRALRAGNFDLVEAVGRAAGRALSVKIDKLIAALFSGFSTGSGSGSGSTMSYTYFGLGYSNLQSNAAPAPYAMVLHPLSMVYLMIDMKYTAPAMGRSDGENKTPLYDLNIAGVSCRTSPNLTVSSSAAYGAIFAKEAIALGIENEPHIELERIQDTGYLLTASVECGVIEVKDLGGYYFNVKAA